MGKIQDLSAAEICGAMIGDGWIQSNEKNMFLAGDTSEDKEYYDKKIKELFQNLSIEATPKKFPYWKAYGIAIYSKKTIKRFLDMEIPKGKKCYNAQIPKWILKSNHEIKTSFIRGLFDTDGGIWCQKDYTKYASDFNSKYHTKIRLRFTSTSFKLQEQLLILLQELGYNCKLRYLKKGATKNRPNNKDVCIVAMDRIDDINNFFTKLIPSNIRHTTKYKIWKNFGFCPPNTTLAQRRDILKKKLNPYDLYKWG